MKPIRIRGDFTARLCSQGFTLLELMITVAIIAILARIALSSYINSVTKSRRTAAEACLSNYATYMERFFATNQSYSVDTNGTALTSLPSTLDCAANQTIQYYTYTFVPNTQTATAYTLQATPIGTQLAKDTQCGTLTLDQTGKQGISGGTGAATTCWQH